LADRLSGKGKAPLRALCLLLFLAACVASTEAPCAEGRDAPSRAFAASDNAGGKDAVAIPGGAAPAESVTEGFSWGGYFRAIGALCIVLALLWGALWLMRRSGRFRFMPAYGAFPRDGLRLEAQLPLGPRKGLAVVRFLNKRVLLGVSDRQITLLSEADVHDGEASADFGKSLENAVRQETDG
jgi:flagellar protein FliO/FliZ